MPRRPPRLAPPSFIMLLLGATCLMSTIGPALAATPGEATDLQVTGYNVATGELSITWTPGCAAADHHIEYGLLQDVAAFGYSGQVCGIGTGGSYASFNPGPGSYFFFVVADDGVAVEGSYGAS